MPKGKSITVNKLRTEANRERWDPPRAPKGVKVLARDEAGQEFWVTGFSNERDALVLTVEAIRGELEIEP